MVLLCSQCSHLDIKDFFAGAFLFDNLAGLGGEHVSLLIQALSFPLSGGTKAGGTEEKKSTNKPKEAENRQRRLAHLHPPPETRY